MKYNLALWVKFYDCLYLVRMFSSRKALVKFIATKRKEGVLNEFEVTNDENISYTDFDSTYPSPNE